MRKYIAECLGTFVLVFIGCGSAVIAGEYIGYLGIAFAFGLTLLVLVYAIGGISGCHVNPAVTIAMLIYGKIKSKEAVGYILVQCIGAIIAAGLLLLIAEAKSGYSITANGIGQNGYGELSLTGYSLFGCFIAELVLTSIFIFIIFASTSSYAPKGFAGISIGFTLVFVHIVGIPITGTSVNPARSLGPAIFAGVDAFLQLWLFWLAPIIGGVIAAFIWKYLFSNNESIPKIS